MQNDISQVGGASRGTTGGTVAVAEPTGPQPEPRLRGHDLNARQMTGIGVMIAGWAAVLAAVLTAGGATSAAGCEQELREQARAVLSWSDTSGGATPHACSGMTTAEVDQIRGQIYGEAFSG